MANFNIDVEQSLRLTFRSHDLLLNFDHNYIVVDSSEKLKIERIQELVKKAGFCSVFSNYRIDGQITFTVTPYQPPEFFTKGTLVLPSTFSILAEMKISKFISTLKEILSSNPLNQQNFRLTQEKIISLAKGLKGSALILGPRHCEGIPLESILEQFDHVTVLDVNLEDVQKALDELPPDLSRKAHLIQKDITGLIPYISKQMEKLEKDIADDICVDQVASIFEKSLEYREIITSARKYDFVVSLFQLSQLNSEFLYYITNILGNICPNLTDYTEILESTQKLKECICEEHLKLIQRCTASGGRIFFADFIKKYEIYPLPTLVVDSDTSDSLQIKFERILKPFGEDISLELFNRTKSTLFDPIKDVEVWDWEMESPITTTHSLETRSGTLFKIAAHSLKLKTNK